MAAFDVDVLVVGAGAAGLSAALSAVDAGLTVRIIDKHTTGLAFSRAILVNPGTMALLESYGVASAIEQNAKSLNGLVLQGAHTELLTIDVNEIRSKYAALPKVLLLPQLKTESFLLAALAARGVQVERPVQMLKYVQDADGVTAQLKVAGSQAAQDIRCRYLVGADGFHSRVRELLGLPFAHDTMPQKIEAIDLQMTWPFVQDARIWFLSEGAVIGIHLALAGERQGLVRLAGSPSAIASLAKSSQWPMCFEHILWQSEFEVHFAAIRHFGQGRVWLAGDAAHVHSPIGGRGMNMGIADGIALGKALAVDLAQGHSGVALRAYSDMRHAIAAPWVKFNQRLSYFVLQTGMRGRLNRLLLRGLVRSLAALKTLTHLDLGAKIFKRLVAL
jgi:2-polyprenyl-6-methoxyphenol hydroxylase-like FAD-dependent oxidoreductase